MIQLDLKKPTPQISLRISLSVFSSSLFLHISRNKFSHEIKSSICFFGEEEKKKGTKNKK